MMACGHVTMYSIVQWAAPVMRLRADVSSRGKASEGQQGAG